MKHIICTLTIICSFIGMNVDAAELNSAETSIYRTLVNYVQEEKEEEFTAELRPQYEDASKILNVLIQMSRQISSLEKSGKFNAEQAQNSQELVFLLINDVLSSADIHNTSSYCERPGRMGHDCYYEVARLLGKPEICEVYKGLNPIVCKEQATVTLARDTINPNLCSGITLSHIKNECYSNVAKFSHNAKICDLVKAPGTERQEADKDMCIFQVAAKSKNPELCSNMSDERNRKHCVAFVEDEIADSNRQSPEEMIAEIKKQVILPDEEPSFTEISDIDAWRESGNAVIKKSLLDAQNGDYVLFFKKAKKVLIYSVSKGKVLYFESYTSR